MIALRTLVCVTLKRSVRYRTPRRTKWTKIVQLSFWFLLRAFRVEALTRDCMDSCAEFTIPFKNCTTLGSLGTSREICPQFYMSDKDALLIIHHLQKYISSSKGQIDTHKFTTKNYRTYWWNSPFLLVSKDMSNQVNSN